MILPMLSHGFPAPELRWPQQGWDTPLGHHPRTGQESLSGFQGFAIAADSVGSWSSDLPMKEPLSPDSPSPSGSLISQLTTE